MLRRPLCSARNKRNIGEYGGKHGVSRMILLGFKIYRGQYIFRPLSRIFPLQRALADRFERRIRCQQVAVVAQFDQRRQSGLLDML